MSGRQWLLSLLIAFHVVAVSVDAIPAPEELKAVIPGIRHPTDDAIASVLTPAFDAIVNPVARVEPHAYAATQPLRRLTRPYIKAGLRQYWNMFTDPFRTDRYVRVDYYVLSPGATTPRRVQELVLPVGHEDSVRVLHDFRDKAVFNLLITYGETKKEAAKHPERQALKTDELMPLVRYFGDRYARELPLGERIVRTEVWSGFAAIPPRGEAVAPEVLAKRLATLTNYYGGPSPAMGRDDTPATGAREREADIVWLLEYVHTS